MAKICLCVSFGSFLMGEKTHKQSPPKSPGQSREMFVYVFFSLCFFAPRKRVLRIESSVDRMPQKGAYRTENGSCEFNSHDPKQTERLGSLEFLEVCLVPICPKRPARR